MTDPADEFGRVARVASLCAMIPIMMAVGPIMGYWLGWWVGGWLGGARVGGGVGLAIGLLAALRQTVHIGRRLIAEGDEQDEGD